jgi:hypothetical protein
MSSIATNLLTLHESKSAIKESIEYKGVEVPHDMHFKAYGDIITDKLVSVEEGFIGLYGKSGDFAIWTLKASGQFNLGVSRVWEYKHFGVFGALLIQGIKGNQLTGVQQLSEGDIGIITEYINQYAPPVIFLVKTPVLVPLNPSISFSSPLDESEAKLLITITLKTYLEETAKPGVEYTAALLEEVFEAVDEITDITILLDIEEGEIFKTTTLEYPIVGEIIW